ncbi:MAG TPA: CBS domain-containing protein [Actinoplanes sp.]|nr:CBS domain-containing protein [Actinoplanes sp.]
MRHWTVQDVMTRDVASVAPDTTYREVVDTLVDRRVSATPVVDDEGRVLGLVSEADLLHKIEAVGQTDRPRIVRSSRRAAAKAQAVTAADLMTAPAVTVSPETSVIAAARRLESERVKRMPVVDAEGRLVGIVSRRDLLRMHTRPDTDIRDDVIDTVLRRTLWIDPLTVQVDVAHGTVTLTGRVESRSVARLIVELTEEVAGVVAVVDKVSWGFDDTELIRSRGFAFGETDKLMRPGTS